RSLYLKDDDYRLSFLYGNFTTLTRFTELDLERVIDEGLSPLFVSIHTTDPALRARMLRNERGAVSLRWLGALLHAGIEVHGQVVVCPGVNDGTALESTFLGILDEFPELATVACVPLGLSRFSTESAMRPHTADEARFVVDAVERYQEIAIGLLGRRLFYAADEYYLMAGRPFPDAAHYDGFPQHENGIGMARAFEAAFAGDESTAFGVRAGFFAAVDGAPPAGYRAVRHRGNDTSGVGHDDRPVTIVTGEFGAAVLRPLLDRYNAARTSGAAVRLLPVRNDYFGGTIAVTGLLTGADVARTLAAEPEGHRYLLPDVCLSEDRFLDGTTLADLPRTVEVVPTDGASLRGALVGAPDAPSVPVALVRR
ncbi:MAG TPA: DUF512 domain-containing protein, partial [Acidimicrobiales bacterium]|nr:DUF512 domain-containing protein [Acidimicrobiales bacterium]